MSRPITSTVLRRGRNVLDALTQLGNAMFLPRPFDTNANESISGRCYREGYLTDLARGDEYRERHARYMNEDQDR